MTEPQWRQSEADAERRELEQAEPEGSGPGRRVIVMERRVFIPLAIMALAGGLVALYLVGGWIAVGAGAVVLAAYYVLGWSAEIGAAILRSRERRELDTLEQKRREGEAG